MGPVYRGSQPPLSGLQDALLFAGVLPQYYSMAAFPLGRHYHAVLKRTATLLSEEETACTMETACALEGHGIPSSPFRRRGAAPGVQWSAPRACHRASGT